MQQSPLETPILFIIFNRPGTTRSVLDAIRSVRPKYLYVAADGPRPNVESDAQRCMAARKVVDEVDWPCEVHKRFSDHNLNCGVGPSSAITWFFDHVSEGIILEDDCLPSKSFFGFCQELLYRYRDDSRVMHIGGNNFLRESENDYNHSYYFSRSGHIWGWATWKRAWKLFDYEMSSYESIKAKGFFDDFFLNNFEKRYRLRKFEKTVARRGSVDWWDYQWDFARYINSGLSIIPKNNLVKNLGFGDDATHTVNSKSKSARLEACEIEFPLSHPPYMIRDVEKDKRYFKLFMRDTIISKFL